MNYDVECSSTNKYIIASLYDKLTIRTLGIPFRSKHLLFQKFASA